MIPLASRSKVLVLTHRKKEKEHAGDGPTHQKIRNNNKSFTVGPSSVFLFSFLCVSHTVLTNDMYGRIVSALSLSFIMSIFAHTFIC